ncbi:coniferyl aldehyde dehydrogenase [Frateuria aurantia]
MIRSASAPGSAGLQPLLARQQAAQLRDGPPPMDVRRARLLRLRAAVLNYRVALGQAVSEDFGHRSRYETDLLELTGIIQSIDYLRRRLKRFMRPERRHVAFIYRSGKAYVSYQPKGVIGIIAPWNYPLSLVLIPLATALAAGNRAMIKPSELTPRTSALLGQLLAEAFAEDEVCVVQGGAEVAAAFSALPLDHLLFTGSTAIGRQVMRSAAEHLVPLTLELGGKSPAVIARGQVNPETVGSLVFGKWSNGGQTCVAPDYALVHEDDLQALVEALDAGVRTAYPEGPLSDDYSSIISERHFQRLRELLDDARGHGAQVIPLGHHPQAAAGRTRTMAPTVVLSASDDAALMQDEIFGPILPVRTYRHMHEAIAYINARPRPLALYYFGPDTPDSRALLARTTSGNVGVNHTLLHVAQDDLPFGGIGPSGMGAYHGIEGFRAMSHAKGIFVQRRLNLPRLLRPPFGRLAEVALRSLLGPRH